MTGFGPSIPAVLTTPAIPATGPISEREGVGQEAVVIVLAVKWEESIKLVVRSMRMEI